MEFYNVDVTPFQKAVIKVVSSVPKGKVVSYGQVAAYVGMPRAARQVGWILRGLNQVDIPWWRVINNQGRISIKGNLYNTPITQKELLEKDGVMVAENFDINIEKYRWNPTIEGLDRFEIDKN